ncbi:MAG: T9SS type A sorting domain-containing protein [candidate division WOR-3 bacterium]|nr:MAG: T9SS type A sorting domain-containing protein [candidate division WOR-3 bacterium]
MKRGLLLVLILIVFGSTQETGARYLIITADAFYDAIQPLAAWKHKKGVSTKVITRGQIGPTVYDIKNYIVDAYTNWQITPEYILFVGAPNYLPFPQVNGVYSDNYFTNMDADIYNEILSGRLTVHSVTEAQVCVSKILKYERTPDLTDSMWFVKGCLIVNEDGDAGDTLYWDDAEYVAAHLVSNGYVYVDTFSRYQGDNANSVIQATSNGRAFVLYRGSATNNWYYPFNVYPDNLANGNELPIVISATCYTLGTGSTPATAERWFLTGTLTTLRGASGYFATTTGGYHLAHLRSAVARGFFDAIFTDGKRTFGEASEGGRLNVYSMYPYGGGAQEYYGFTTIGDPEMNIWTAVPQVLDVQHPASISVDDESLRVQVLCNEMPLDSALVCVMLDTIVYQHGYTSGGGNITFYFSNLVQDLMEITVTGKNVIPYEGFIEVQGSGINTDRHTDIIGTRVIHISPNPFTNHTTISIEQNAGNVELQIYDVMGRNVKSFYLLSAYSLLPTVFSWDGTDNSGNRLAPGVYMCQLRTTDEIVLEKIVIVE